MPAWVPYLFLGIGLLLALFAKDCSKHYPVSLIRFGVAALFSLLLLKQLSLMSLLVLLSALVWAAFGAHRLFSTIGLILLSIVLMLHQFPCISNWLLYDDLLVSSQAFDFYAGFDKGFAGLLLLMLLSKMPTLQIQATNLIIAGLWFVIGLLVMPMLAWGLGVTIDPKFPSETFGFITVNMLFTVAPEEALFRGLLQAACVHWLIKNNQSPYWAIGAVSILFGAAHFSGGWLWVVLATSAGIFYGLVYHYSGRLSFAVALHACVNVCHFLLLEYPLAH